MLENKKPNEQIINLDNTVTGKDIYGTEHLIMKMYCTIRVGEMINMSYDIVNKEIYNFNKDYCNEKCQEFKLQCEQIARDNGVAIF